MSAARHAYHRFRHEAMATSFELTLAGDDAAYAEQAARAAFELVDRIEREISRYVSTSDVARVNRGAGGEPIVVGAAALECLELARRMHGETGGAFDPTVGPLVSLWREAAKAGRAPRDDEIAAARRSSGMDLLELDAAHRAVRLRAPGAAIDLGGIGKGYAADTVARLLAEWSIEAALIDAGQSSLLVAGVPPPGDEDGGWQLSIPDPDDPRAAPLATVRLRGGSISGSSLRKGPHIIDPRTGRPASGRRAAWSRAPAAAVSDALSTAFMIMTVEEVEECCRRRPGTAALLVLSKDAASARGSRIVRCGVNGL